MGRWVQEIKKKTLNENRSNRYLKTTIRYGQNKEIGVVTKSCFKMRNVNFETCQNDNNTLTICTTLYTS